MIQYWMTIWNLNDLMEREWWLNTWTLFEWLLIEWLLIEWLLFEWWKNKISDETWSIEWSRCFMRNRKGSRLRVRHSVNGQRPKYLAVLWNPKKLSGTYEMLNDTDWQWMTCNILNDIEWLVIYWMMLNDM